MAVEYHPENPHGFEHAAQFTNDHNRLVCKNPALQAIAEAFIRNMSRVRGIGMMPINLVAISVSNEAAQMEAMANLKIPFHDSRITYGHPDFDPILFDKVSIERKRLLKEWSKDPAVNQNQKHFLVGAYAINLVIDSNQAQSWEGVQATLAAMLMGLWTAFESLTQDTWIEAVNTCPNPLAERVLEPSANLKTGSQLKSVSWKVIKSAGFDLTGSMGSVLLRQKAVDFQQLETIRAAYDVAFAGEFEPIFSAHEEQLSQLEAVRNLFAHKGGTIDRKFIDRMKNVPDLKDMKEGEVFCVTGQYVAQKANTISQCSTSLISGVDNWLEQNPSKP